MEAVALSARRTRTGIRQAFVSVVVPLYDEEANLPELHRRLSLTLSETLLDYELLFVDDGSRDATPRMLANLVADDPHTTALHFSRNFGHQAAVSAGLEHARGDAVIVMDGDLQDPPEVLPRFLAKWREGHDVVYAVRRKRKEGVFKRLCYFGFYRLMRSASDLDLPLDAGDFCLLDRQAVDALNRLPERVRFVRGLRRFVGFRQTGLEYERDRRAAGVPKYTLRKLVGLAVDGLFNFSAFPLRLVLGGGVLAGIASVILAVLALVQASATLGLLAAIAFASALQFLALGVLGEYSRRILLEVKGRPAYIVREILRHDETVESAARAA